MFTHNKTRYNTLLSLFIVTCLYVLYALFLIHVLYTNDILLLCLFFLCVIITIISIKSFRL